MAYFTSGLGPEERERAEASLRRFVMDHIKEMREQMDGLNERVASLEADQHTKGGDGLLSCSRGSSPPTGGEDE